MISLGELDHRIGAVLGFLPSHGDLEEVQAYVAAVRVLGEFICEKTNFNLFGRVILFRPDLYRHEVSEIEDGTRWLLSFAVNH